ncbi:unnamed protein product [Sphagnum tenellum]
MDNVFMAQKALDWAKESDQYLILLLLDFEKAFEKIEWGFLFTALAKFGFDNTCVCWVRSLYQATSLAIKDRMGVPLHGVGEARLRQHLGKLREIALPSNVISHKSK